MISTVASGRRAEICRPADIMMMYSVTDVQGLNSISRQVLANGAQAMAGMVKARASKRRRRCRDGPPTCRHRAHHVRRHHACVQQVRGAGRRL